MICREIRWKPNELMKPKKKRKTLLSLGQLKGKFSLHMYTRAERRIDVVHARAKKCDGVSVRACTQEPGNNSRQNNSQGHLANRSAHKYVHTPHTRKRVQI